MGDGQMLFWDVRKLKAPTDKVTLKNDEGQVLGGSALEYNQEAGPTKYLVGTERGVVLSVNLRNRKQNDGVSQFDSGPGRHHGPLCLHHIWLLVAHARRRLLRRAYGRCRRH